MTAVDLSPAPYADSPAPTFRDPAGSLRLEPGCAIRQVRPESAAATLALLDSQLMHELVAAGHVVASRVQQHREALQLIHPRLEPATYPWEWTPTQWLAAAELTLQLCATALDYGYILKDATPLNIVFTGPRPVLVDVLSFEPLPPGQSTWLAYGQFVRSFLLPLLMLKLRGWPLALSLFRRDGYEPAELYAALPWTARLAPSALLPITLPALLERRTTTKPAAKPVAPQPASKDPALALHLLRRTLRGLQSSTRSALPRSARSAWSNYTRSLRHYSPAEMAEKSSFVQQTLLELRPARVLDIGANTGEFSAMAAAAGAEVIALERDAAAADVLFQRSRRDELNILTVHADLARPTPAVGWCNAESSALLPRLAGQADLVLLLAVLHHLLLLDQLPLRSILQLLHNLTRTHLILEWVPPTDPMFQSLLRGRDHLYGHLSEADLLTACEGLFLPLRRQALSNCRLLFLLERVAPVAPQPHTERAPQ